jgi:hypothetical protein
MSAAPVVFRKWRDSGDIIALFPELPASIHGEYCLSYERVGQHAAADYHGVICHTLPAAPHEYAALTDELARIGYRLKPQRRASWRHHQRRRALPNPSGTDTRYTSGSGVAPEDNPTQPFQEID